MSEIQSSHDYTPADVIGAVQLMKQAVEIARNDEILELAVLLHDEMVDRCANAVDLAIDADDRDAMNEAFVLVKRVQDLLPTWLGNSNSRSDRTYWRHHHVEKQIEEAVDYSRAFGRGPRPVPQRTALQPPPALPRRDRAAERRAIDKLDLSSATVLEALRTASVEGPTQVGTVADALIAAASIKPAKMAKSIRQSVIARVSQILMQAARDGAVVQHRPADSQCGRITSRWAAA